ncbi:MAG: DUF4998 domain-containing protein [Proteiniphilum sp.]
MSNRINKVYFMLCVVFVIGFTTCDKMDTTYKHFWEDGEKIYPAPADSLKLYAGKNRAGVSWKVLGDPNVNLVRIFWNNRSDSLNVPFQPQSVKDSTFIIIDDMTEGSYSFEIFTYDNKGNRSVPREGIGNVYGNTYERTLLARFMQSALFAKDTLKIIWGVQGDDTAIGSEIYYRNTLGTQSKVTVGNDEKSTIILDYDFESSPSITYRTVYVPPTSIDTFYTAIKTVAVRGAPAYFPKAGWIATASSFDSRAGASYRPPEHTIDGNKATLWVNQISPQTFFPHTLYIDMGEIKHDVGGISLVVQRRNESPRLIDILVSVDGENWDMMGLYSVENLADVVQDFDFILPQNIRYFSIVCKEPWGATNNVVIAEVEAYTYVRE